MKLLGKVLQIYCVALCGQRMQSHITNYLLRYHQIAANYSLQCDQIEFVYVNGCVAIFKRSISIESTWLLWIAGKVAIVTT